MKLTREQRAHRREIDTIDRTLRSFAFPAEPRVVEIRYRLADGFEGDPVVFVWLILADDDVSDDDFSRIHPLRRAVSEALLDAEIESWPVVGIRAASEQREIASDEVPPTGAISADELNRPAS